MSDATPKAPPVAPNLSNPLAPPPPAQQAAQGPYDAALAMGQELREKPYNAGSRVQVGKQHDKGRMTVWERIRVAQGPRTTSRAMLYQNWGPEPRRRVAWSPPF